ncbi:glucose-6-phosphate dehydrogenase [Ravibacter arvi]|uniref:Glucose-6-phosphate 1-dehydrogenase n=1 Tax=Ravibacter arvi TaxID=2051041 RepID=A0ABP8M013_9BACT
MNASNHPPASILFIFGGSGDLNHRKLTPALYNLFLDDWLPEQFLISGIGRSQYDDESFRGHLLDGVKQFSRRKEEINGKWEAFSRHIAYLQMDGDKAEDYQKIARIVHDKTEEWGVRPHVVFYLAVAPQLVPAIASNLGKLDICADKTTSRIVVEKPFGHDLKSARELNTQLRSLFAEEQIFRIDHYLGKETVQNILMMRFANALFEPIWNRNYIDHIQITAIESVGVEGRGGYFEQSGALRDMVQNHILQILCMIAMEAPVSFEANEIRNKNLDVLNALRRYTDAEVAENAVRGQYGAGSNNGKPVLAYRDEKGVAADSNVETYAAARFFIDNWRWQGVPFFVRTGKSLHMKETHVVIQFKSPPHNTFPHEAAENWKSNRLTISIQPNMDIRIRFQVKRPGQTMKLDPVEMAFDYTAAGENAPEAYETLLLDALEGDPTLFMRGDQVEAAWEVIMPILSHWEKNKAADFPNYQPGSWGPLAADQLIEEEDRHWVNVLQSEN